MKKGFTLIELIVVMVIIALLIGILLPALGRGREEARKTQCRSNLRQIYTAMSLYAADNSGLLPTLYGWGTGNSLSTNDDDEQAAFFHLLTTDVANGTYNQPAHPTGLGLIYRGGYLTYSGARLLDCPSRHYSLGIGLNRQQAMEFDLDEPFFTSKGLYWFSDADGIENFQNHASLSGAPACARTGGGGNRKLPCCLLTAYSLRLGDTGDGFSRIRLEEWSARGILTDTLVGFALGAGSGGVDLKRYIQNHEASWNILFGDGAVKTFSDSSHHVLSKLKIGTEMNGGESMTAAGVGPSGAYISRHVFETYLDTAYQAD